MPPSRWPLVRALLLTITVLLVVEFVVATVGVQIRSLPARTDFASYYLAGQLSRDGHNPYDHALLAEAGRGLGFEHEQYPFLYPPPFAVAMQPLALLSYPQARALWMLLSTVALFLALLSTVRLVHDLLRTQGATRPVLTWVLCVPFVAMALHSTAVHNDLRSGSVGCLLWLTLVLLLQAVMRGRALQAGLWLAMATLLKLVPLALLPWIAWRCGRRAVWATLGFLLLSMLPAWALWDVDILWSYGRDALWPASQLQVPWPHNVSLTALWLRLLSPVLALEDAASEGGFLVLGPAILSELLLLGFTVHVLRHRQADTVRRAVEGTALVLVLLLAMRITWVHSLTAMLFAYPVLVCAMGVGFEAGAARRGMVLLGAAFFLAAAHLPVLWGERWMTWPWLLAPGLHTLGLLGLWGVAVVWLRRPRNAPES